MTKTKTFNADQILATLNDIEEQTVNAALAEKQKMETSVTLNGKTVRCTATPQANPNRSPYTLFYVDEKRKARKAVTTLVLSV